jgi:RNA polymerase sigma factor (sigma-70 family)
MEGGSGSCGAAGVLRVHSGKRLISTADPAGLVQEVYPVLLATARSLVPAADAADLVQDAIVETLVRHPGFDGIDRPLGYLRTVLFRLAIRRWRMRSLEVSLDLQDRLEAPAQPIDDRLMAEHALAELGVRQRACVGLRYLHGFDDEAIAEALRCRPSTVRSQTARALAKLRTDMEADDGYA